MKFIELTTTANTKMTVNFETVMAYQPHNRDCTMIVHVGGEAVIVKENYDLVKHLLARKVTAPVD